MEEIRDEDGKLVCCVEPRERKVEIVKGKRKAIVQFLQNGEFKSLIKRIKHKA